MRNNPKEPDQEAPIVKNGWTIYAHPLLLDQLEKLVAKAREEGDRQGPATKVLAWVTRAMFDEIPFGPNHQDYRQGHTLGKENTHWFRDKYAGRFRLFFRFDSKAKVIIFAWVNDDQTLRTYGDKNDAYAVFKGMLADGNPPNKWSELLAEASAQPAIGRLNKIG